jgi:transforming growth factor-beta-induced protein
MALAYPASAQAGLPIWDFLNWQRDFDRPNLVELVLRENERTGDFDTLVAALSAVSSDPDQPDLLTTLADQGPFTVFAPTDEAFGQLGLTPENVGSALPLGSLTDVLLYHVTAGRKGAVRLLLERDIEMLSGDDAEFRFRFWPLGFYIDDAKVIAANKRASNGIVHVIDGVLMPPAGAGVASIPEPSGWALLACGAVAVGRRRRVPC